MQRQRPDFTSDELLLFDCAGNWLTPVELQEITGMPHRVASTSLRRSLDRGLVWRKKRANGHWEYRTKRETIDRLRRKMSSNINTIATA